MKTFLMSLFFLLIVPQICFGQWIQTSFPDAVPVFLTVKEPYLYAGASNGVYRSIDNGDSWDAVDSGLACENFRTIAFSGNNILTGSYGGRCGSIYLSTDNGTSWSEVLDSRINCLISDGENVFAGYYYGIYRSLDNGLTWNPVNNGLPSEPIILVLAVSGLKIFAGSDSDGIFVTTDNGSNWTAVNNGLSSLHISALAVSGNYIFAGTQDGIFRSTDNGANWFSVNSGLTSDTITTDLTVSNFAVNNSNIFVSIAYYYDIKSPGFVYLSSNFGETWDDVSLGLPIEFDVIYTLTSNDKYLFVGDNPYNDNPHVWRRPLSEMITDVKENFSPSLDKFNIYQNYPNPFNPSTKIKYSVPQSSHIQIKVFDVLGNEIETLVNEAKPAGTYELSWNAANLLSGVYFYQLRADDFVQTKKMILLK